jgi:RNA polymerase sigma-70 factor (ECF subfamily)
MGDALPANVDRAARIETWLDLYGDAILRSCYTWLKDKQLAEDAMQECFFKAWKAMDRFDNSAGNEKAWLMRIAINTCKDFKKSPWSRHVDRAQDMDNLPPHLLLAEDEDQALYLSILSLPLKHRQILLLYHYHGLTLKECAQALGIVLTSARYRLKKAELLLKQQLEKGEGL